MPKPPATEEVSFDELMSPRAGRPAEAIPSRKRVGLAICSVFGLVAALVGSMGAPSVLATNAAQDINDHFDGARARFLEGLFGDEPQNILTADRAEDLEPLLIQAIGDSVMAGGAGASSGVFPSSVEPNGRSGCWRSSESPAAVATRALGGIGTNLACAGATITEIVEEQIPRISPVADVVLVTMGANDMRLIQSVAQCIPRQIHPVACADTIIPLIDSNMAQTGRDLEAALRMVRVQAPNALVVLSGYLDPLPLETQSFCDSAREDDLVAMHNSFRTLQQIMRSAARRAGVEFFDAAASIDPAVCTTSSLIVDATAFNYIERNGAGLLHPTNAGSAAIGYGIERFIENKLSQQYIDPSVAVLAGGIGG